MKKINILLLGVTFLLLNQIVNAEVKLPAIVSSNMVLQRNATVVLWGWAGANEKISIKATWLEQILNIQADKQGNWRVEVKTTGSKESQTINVKSKSSDITLSNVLLGEVWLCSGQSNMQQPLKGYTGQPTFGGDMEIVKSNNFNLRVFSVNKRGSKTSLTDVKDYESWQQASPETVAGFSAIAYYFGQQLQEVLDVPVGMIHTSWGGSTVEAWISKEMMANFDVVNLEDVDITKGTNHIPTALFNAMINPLIPYTIKGALWYQGESNRLHPKKYKDLFPAMVQDWRSRWMIGDFPFYYVQISPYLYGGNEFYETAENSAFIREAQLQCLDLIPNSGIAITMDIGDEHSIHPPKKKEVADRLLFNALNKTYGYSKIEYISPIYNSIEINNEGIIVKFKNGEEGLFAYEELSGFQIAGEDKVFYPATARIQNKKVLFVKSEAVKNPVAVRYAWYNWIEGSLYGTNLIPATSFRSDDWNDATQYKK